MKIKTRLFGEIEINDEKIINFDMGLIGYDFLKRFTLIHDEENEDASIIWLQSLDEATFALPVMNPIFVYENYNPKVEDELFKSIGDIDEDVIVLVTVTVPAEVEKMSVNLKAPIIINPKSIKGCQIILDDAEYPVRYEVYDLLKQKKTKGGE